MFDQLKAEQDSEGTAAQYVYARNKYSEFLLATSAYYEEMAVDKRFELQKYWEADALVRFNRWLSAQKLASKTKYSIYKCVRCVMDYAYALRLLDSPVYHAPMFKGVIETEERTAYRADQQEMVNAAIARWISLGISVVNGYQPTGKGVPYRKRIHVASIRACAGAREIVKTKGDANGISKPLMVDGVLYASIAQAAAAYKMNCTTVAMRLRKGLTAEQAVGVVPITVQRKDERALLWAFENEYACDPLRMLLDFKSRGMGAVATETDLRKYFMRWGVWPYVDDRLIMPLAAEFAMLTGLNVESLRSLTLNSYEPSHPLTHQAAIRFTKNRAGSSMRPNELALHLSTIEHEEIYIDGPQVEKVHRLILLITALTAEIRPFAPENIKNKLIIFEDVEASRRAGRKVIVDYDPRGKAGQWYGRFKRESGFTGMFGEEASFNVAKCRPTLVTNLVLEGASMTRIQAVLTHANIASTMKYLSERQLRPQFNRTMSEAITEISRRSKAAVPRTEGRSISAQSATVQPIKFYDTISGVGCSDPFNPSQNVRQASNYVPGSVCKFWNMCLLCDSSLVTENSLPKLIMYSWRVKEAIRLNTPAVQPKLILLKQVAELLDGILEPDSIFPQDVLSAALVKAASMDDIMADMLIYQGV